MVGWVILVVVLVLLILIFYPGNIFKFAMSSLRKSAGLARKEIMVGNHKIVYLEGGSGPNMLLLHGFGGNKDNWPRFAKAFTPSYRVVIPDLPGFGESSFIMIDEYTVEAQVERLHNLTQVLKMDKFHLAGNSMGGQIASVYAAKYPEQVLSLILLDAAGIDEPNPSEFTLSLQKGINHLLVNEPSDFGRLMSFVCYSAPTYPVAVAKGLAEDAAKHAASNKRIFNELRVNWVKLDNILPQIQCPTLVIWGKNDRVFDVSCVPRFEALLKNVKTVIVDNCGHLPMLEKPEQTAELVKQFIA